MESTYNNIKTVVDKVVYYSKTSKWGVLSVRNTLENDRLLTDKKLTLTGNFDEVYAGCEIIFSGDIVSNPKYGFQIAVSNLRINKDVNTKEGIINFLIKSKIKGISVALAQKIYDKFKEDSIRIVLHQTERLKEINGIGENTFREVSESIGEYMRMEELIAFCTSKNIPFPVMYKLDTEFGDKALKILKEDIYSIIEISDDFSFNSIDEIALKIGCKKDDPKRLRASLIYCVKTNVMMTSSTGITVGNLKQLFAKVTGLADQSYYNATITKLIHEKLIIVDGTHVYWKYYYDKEEFAAQMLMYLKDVPLKTELPLESIEKAINSFPFQLNEQQTQAIKGVVKSRVSILTGGPGTGKSTITKAITDVFKANKVNFVLLSPTGKATRRLAECTGGTAYTIHKYLHAKSASLEDVELPIVPQDTAIIIDESSMLDILMFAKLLEIAKFTPIRLILIGDQDQLPSVQVGNVLADVIASGVANVFKLTDIMRQSQDSHIIKFCADINSGKLIKQCNYDDFEYVEFYDDNDLFYELQEKYQQEEDKHGIFDVQVIAPYKKGKLGTIALNKFISDMNPNERGSLGYAEEDKVMQIRNDYSRGVFNGECGIVRSCGDDFVGVGFGEDYGKDTAGAHHLQALNLYDERSLQDIMLAYASTCHKSQGAEYSVVFIILDDESGNFLLTRRLLYTAVSRGKQKVYIYSSPGCVSKCIKNTSEVQRITKLTQLLQMVNNVSNWDEIDEIPF